MKRQVKTRTETRRKTQQRSTVLISLSVIIIIVLTLPNITLLSTEQTRGETDTENLEAVPTEIRPTMAPTAAPRITAEAPEGFGGLVLPETAEATEALIEMVENPPELLRGLSLPEVEDELGQHQANILNLITQGGQERQLSTEAVWWARATQGNTPEAQTAREVFEETIEAIDLMARFEEVPAGLGTGVYIARSPSNPGLTIEAIPIIANAISALDALGANEQAQQLQADAMKAIRIEAAEALIQEQEEALVEAPQEQQAPEQGEQEEIWVEEEPNTEVGQTTEQDQDTEQVVIEEDPAVGPPTGQSVGTPVVINPEARMPGLVVSPASHLITVRQIWQFLRGQPVGTTYQVVEVRKAAPAGANLMKRLGWEDPAFWYITIQERQADVAYIFIILWGVRPCEVGDVFEVGNIGLVLKRLQ